MTKNLLFLTLGLSSLAVSGTAYHELHRVPTPVRFETARATRGDIVANVVATGTLQAVKTVEVGTQASGIIKELNVDYNSVVHKGEVIARLDAAIIQAQIDQARATVEKAKSDVERLRVAQDEANRELARAQALFAKALLDESDLETARVAAEQATADVKAAEAQVAEAQATVDGGVVNLAHTVITSPIEGIVIARNVDVGQTVVSTMQAQTLFEIAEDLGRMQLNATIDESDVGRVREGDPVTFTVDAYPADTFSGVVSQVRMNPNVDQNVVTYTTVIDVSNVGLKLRPGMTANLSVRVDSRHDVLRVPSLALRFKPNEELFALLHQALPSPAKNSAAAAPVRTGTHATTARPASGTVWVLRNNQMQPATVQLGLSDGTETEVVAGNIQPDAVIVLNATASR